MVKPWIRQLINGFRTFCLVLIITSMSGGTMAVYPDMPDADLIELSERSPETETEREAEKEKETEETDDKLSNSYLAHHDLDPYMLRGFGFNSLDLFNFYEEVFTPPPKEVQPGIVIRKSITSINHFKTDT